MPKILFFPSTSQDPAQWLHPRGCPWGGGTGTLPAPRCPCPWRELRAGTRPGYSAICTADRSCLLPAEATSPAIVRRPWDTASGFFVVVGFYFFFPLPSLLELGARCLGGSCGSRGRAALLARWLGRGPARVSGLQRCGGGTAAPGRHGGGEERERGQLLCRRGLRCGEATGLEPCCWPSPLRLR